MLQGNPFLGTTEMNLLPKSHAPGLLRSEDAGRIQCDLAGLVLEAAHMTIVAGGTSSYFDPFNIWHSRSVLIRRCWQTPVWLNTLFWEPKFHYDLNPCSRSHCRDFASALVYVTFLCYELRSCFSRSVVKFSHAAATRKLQPLSSCSPISGRSSRAWNSSNENCVCEFKQVPKGWFKWRKGHHKLYTYQQFKLHFSWSSYILKPFWCSHFIQAARPLNIRNRCSSHSWRILGGIFFPPWPRYTTNLIKLPDCITAASFEITFTTQTSSKKASLHVQDRSRVKPSIRFLPAVWLQKFRSFHNSCTPADGQHQLLTCSTHSEQELVNRPPIATC